MGLITPGGGGGGSAVAAKSYLKTTFASTINIDSLGFTVATFDSPADHLVGTDLSISVDGQTINFLTSGIYSILLSGQVTGSASCTFYLIVSPSGTVTDPFFGGLEYKVAITTTTTVPLITVPAMYYTAGDSFQMSASLVGGGSPTATWKPTLIVSKVL